MTLRIEHICSFDTSPTACDHLLFFHYFLSPCFSLELLRLFYGPSRKGVLDFQLHRRVISKYLSAFGRSCAAKVATNLYFEFQINCFIKDFVWPVCVQTSLTYFMFGGLCRKICEDDILHLTLVKWFERGHIKILSDV